MSNPQQPELARSRKTPGLDPDAVATVVEGQRHPGADEARGPVPAENQPGHHPAEEQDKPELNAFAEKLGTMEPAERQERAEEREAAAGRRVPAGTAAVVAALIAVLLAVIIGRRRRARR